MQIDKDDRYVSEPPKKNSASFLKLPSLQGLSKPKLIILAFSVVIILVLLSLIIFRSLSKNEPSQLTPPTIAGVQQPVTDANQSENSVNNTQTIVNNTNGENAANNSQQSLAPAPISRTPTEAQTRVPQQQGRIEIPGEIVDKLSQNNGTTSATPITPTPTAVPHSNSSTSVAIPNKIADDHFSIQLSASSSFQSLKEFVRKNQIVNYQIYETKRNDKPWFVLIQGYYSSSNDAKEAIKSLPSVLQKNEPWIKRGDAINKEKAIK